MTEIKLTLDETCSPQWLASNLRSRARFMGNTVGDRGSANSLMEIADAIEGQAKPAIEEPTGDVLVAFSIHHHRGGSIYAEDDGLWGDGGTEMPWAELIGDAIPSDIMLYQRVPYPQSDGGAAADSWRDGYTKGTDNARSRHIDILEALKPSLITAPEKNAIDTALAAIKADVENTVTGPGFPS